MTFSKRLFAGPLVLGSGLMVVVLATTTSRATEYLAVDAVELTAAMAAAGPGDRVVMAAGEWRDLELVLRFAGEPSRPVTVVGAERGQTVLVGTVRLVLEGSHGVVSGLSFSGATAMADADAMVDIGGTDRPSFRRSRSRTLAPRGRATSSRGWRQRDRPWLRWRSRCGP